MSTNHTKNYRLCQWIPSDKVLRTDFNEDNAKIDAAIAANRTSINQIKAVADMAYTQDNQPVVVGSYDGDGSTSRRITLGFHPHSVVVFTTKGDLSYLTNGTRAVNNGVATRNLKAGDDQCGSLVLLSNGFQVANMEYRQYLYTLNQNQYDLHLFRVPLSIGETPGTLVPGV